MDGISLLDSDLRKHSLERSKNTNNSSGEGKQNSAQKLHVKSDKMIGTSRKKISRLSSKISKSP
jgi:hypothetical protein